MACAASVAYLERRYSQHSISTLLQACFALNNLIASDPFQAERARFIPAASQRAFVNLRGLFVSELMARYGMKKASVQSLLDELSRLERTLPPGPHVPLKVRGSGAEVAHAQAGKKEESKEP